MGTKIQQHPLFLYKNVLGSNQLGSNQLAANSAGRTVKPVDPENRLNITAEQKTELEKASTDMKSRSVEHQNLHGKTYLIIDDKNKAGFSVMRTSLDGQIVTENGPATFSTNNQLHQFGEPADRSELAKEAYLQELLYSYLGKVYNDSQQNMTEHNYDRLEHLGLQALFLHNSQVNSLDSYDPLITVSLLSLASKLEDSGRYQEVSTVFDTMVAIKNNTSALDIQELMEILNFDDLSFQKEFNTHDNTYKKMVYYREKTEQTKQRNINNLLQKSGFTTANLI